MAGFTRMLLLLFVALGLVASGPALAKKVYLQGASANLDGKYEFRFEDGDLAKGCGPIKENTNLDVSFNGGRVTGSLAGTFFEGKFKQSGNGGRKLKVKLSKNSKLALAGGLGNLLDSCILNLGSKVTKLREVRIKGSINKKLNKLKVVVEVEFKGKGNGFFHDLSGDDEDIYLLKVKGPLTVLPRPPKPPKGNVAVKGNATQSSTGFGGTPDRAIDGNTDGWYGNGSVTSTAEGDPAPWWEVDLGREYPIEDVVLFNRTDCCAERLDYVSIVLRSESGSTTIAQLQDGNIPSPQVRVNFSGSLARYVRVAIRPQASVPTPYLSLAEVQVFVR